MNLRATPDVHGALADGLAAIRDEFEVPASFPAEVVAAAEDAARRPVEMADRRDATALPLVTLDPAASTDLDQAFTIEPDGDDLVLRYAIADVPFFVEPGGPIEQEAWRRGVTVYLPDGKAGLYPPVLAEGAASLLPDGPRPAFLISVRVPPSGDTALDGMERVLVRSRAKLGYETATAADLPTGFDEFARRIVAAEDRRGAARVEFPEQEVDLDPDQAGAFQLQLRPRRPVEDGNSALSLAANLAVAGALVAARTGLFRVMADPDERELRMLRHSARALGITWPGDTDLKTVERSLDSANPREAAFLLAIRRASGGASYEPYTDGVRPWHSAMAATYAHATAPLRRLADRYVLEAALAVWHHDPVPGHVTDAFGQLHDVMERAESRASQVDRAVVDLAEAVVLASHVGEVFRAVVVDTDRNGARIQLSDLPVIARVGANHVEPGDPVRVRLASADPAKRHVEFQRVG